ncbi:hypothetical protein SAMN05660420_00686 [Desulfuromusa kysingii]|uniref:Uncharacterized protein n=1 Tax=Desulfuromusa kysingii TaxID=37625 RepID=A0A1H3WV51_9BACT|nr:hypothetical protein SAMN05660420_00686 [Desulfuromusa kysingii]
MVVRASVFPAIFVGSIRSDWILYDIDPVITPPELLNFPKVKQDIQKFLFDCIFPTVFIDDLDLQS